MCKLFLTHPSLSLSLPLSSSRTPFLSRLHSLTLSLSFCLSPSHFHHPPCLLLTLPVNVDCLHSLSHYLSVFINLTFSSCLPFTSPLHLPIPLSTFYSLSVSIFYLSFLSLSVSLTPTVSLIPLSLVLVLQCQFLKLP